MPNDEAGFEPLYDVAIIGAGFSGTLTAIHLLGSGADGDRPVSVALIEKEPSAFGRGVAYGTPCEQHLLNVPAAKMGAFPEEPEGFLRWLESHPDESRAFGLKEVGAGMFLPRMLYGRYVSSLLEEAAGRAGGRFNRIAGEAVEILPGGDDAAARIELADGRCLRAGRVVLALGTLPPGDPRLRDARFRRSPRYLYSPWSAETHARLAAPGDVLILGSGLTALDLLLTLRERKSEGTLHVLSRHGIFPQPHRSGVAAWPAFLRSGALPTTVRAMLRLIRQQIAAAGAAGSDWRAVVDSLRPFTQEFWQGLSRAEKSRFLRHLRALWEPHRHRAAPEALAVKGELESAGRLVGHRGRIERIAEVEGGSELEVVFRPHGTAGERKTLRVGYVVNCTGPECNYHRLGDPLVTGLFAQGLARPDTLVLGLDVGENGAVNDVDGVASEWLYTLGSPQKGRLLETTAVPELRGQARDLAAHLLRCRVNGLAPSGAAVGAGVGKSKRIVAYEI